MDRRSELKEPVGLYEMVGNGPPEPRSSRPDRKVMVLRLRHWVEWEVHRDLASISEDYSRPDVIIELSEPLDLAATVLLSSFVAQARRRGQRVVIVSGQPVPDDALLAHGLYRSLPIVSSEEEARSCLDGLSTPAK